jgi:uncharacterized protein
MNVSFCRRGFELNWTKLCFVSFGVLVLCMESTSYATSFDCSRAKTATEKTVCSDWTLSTFDEVLAQRYLTVLAEESDPERTKSDQRKWLDLRNACSADHACLRRAYEARLAVFKLDHFDIEGETTNVLGCDGTAETMTIARVTGTEAKAAPSSTTRIAKGLVTSLLPSTDKSYNECLFASGQSIRIKLGEYEPYPYGRCGADPGSFFSVWMNRAKVASRERLRESCGFGALVKAEVSRHALHMCHMWSDGKLECSSTPLGTTRQADLEEYPVRPTKKGPIGSYVMEYAADRKLCKGMLFGPKDDPATPYWHIAPPVTATLFEDGVQSPTGSTTKVLTSRFDMNNDGKPDSVVAFQFDNRQRESSTFLAQRADVAEKEVSEIDAKFLGKNSFAVYPHNWGNCKGGFDKDNWDDEGCSIPLRHFAPDGRQFAYDVTALTLYPFGNGKTTYFLGLGPHYRSESVATVWEPRPNGQAKEVCIFRRSLENY